jgi:NitT/TauT family transport system permease protein
VSTPKWKKTLVRSLQIAAVWLLVLALWEGAYRAIGWRPWIFPAPSHVLDAALGMLNVRTFFGEPLHGGWPCTLAPHEGGELGPAPRGGILGSPLLEALGVSGVRLLIGFSASLAIGLIVGVALWRFAFFNALAGPLALGFQTLPSVCWVPLAILIFGITEFSILFVLIMGSVFSSAIAMRDGLKALPPIYWSAGRMLGATGARLYACVLLPASTPALAGTLRQGFSFAWRSLLGAELIMLTQRRGMGFLLNMGRDFADIAQVVAVMLVMVFVGMTMDRWVFAEIERRVRQRFGLAHSR